MEAFSLEGQTLLLTGASGDIGHGIAHCLATAGACLVLHGRQQELLRALQAALPPVAKGPHQYIASDLSTDEGRDTLVKHLPPLEGAVFAAGIVQPFPLHRLQATHLRSMMAINYEAPTLLTGQLLRHKVLERPCALVYISSLAVTQPYYGSASYASSKAALEAFVRNVVLEWREQGVRANIVAPGMTASRIATQSMGSKTLELAEPADVGWSCVFLTAPASRWVNGQTLTLEGGTTLRHPG
jgi:NAD(P)-dependent dehydrogenase (short-subunit alcohol dehydrogenase family)